VSAIGQIYLISFDFSVFRIFIPTTQLPDSMSQPMFSEITSHVTLGIRVEVRTIYLGDESSPAQSHYVFAYQVKIVNESDDVVQLLSRKWNIVDALGERRTVEGEGVVGKQPVLARGEFHEYVSGCDFRTPIGKMGGYYLFVRSHDASEFKVRIPSFVMVAPAFLN
jgi:ApaG protein